MWLSFAPQGEQRCPVVEQSDMNQRQLQGAYSISLRVKPLQEHTYCDYHSGGLTFAWCLVLAKGGGRCS
jgi:hypothetical protein